MEAFGARAIRPDHLALDSDWRSKVEKGGRSVEANAAERSSALEGAYKVEDDRRSSWGGVISKMLKRMLHRPRENI